MLQTYKLRLSDGTVLGVDHDGLSTWLVDRRAMVQAAGSHQWQPLREFLAAERAAARRTSRYALRQKPTSRQELPLVYPKPRAEQAPAPPSSGAPQEGASPDPPFVLESSEVQVLGGDISESGGILAMDTSSLPEISGEIPVALSGPDGGAPSHPAIPEEDIPIPLEPLAATPPLEPSASTWHDSQESASEPWDDPVFVEEVAFPSPEVTPPPPPVLEEDFPPVSQEPLGTVATSEPHVPPSHDPSEPPSIGDLVDSAILGDLSAPQPSVPATVLSLPQLVPQAEVPLVPVEEVDPLASVPSAALSWREPVVPTWSAPQPNLQVLADDPVGPAPDPTRQAPAPVDALPIIPLKPLDEEARPSLVPEPAPEEEAESAEPWRARLEDVLLRVISSCYALLTQGTDRIAGVERPWARWIPKLSEARRRVSERIAGLTARTAAPSVSQDPSWLTDPVDEAAALGVVARGPSQPLKPPPPISELPVLRFAGAPEAEQAGDVYEGEGFRHAAWRWAKRIVVTSGLVAGVLAAVLTRDTWVPPAAQFGRMIVTEIDREVQSRDQAEQQRRALQEATEQLPHLSPATIRLLLSGSSTGVPDPTEVFALACDAADRGQSALTAAEAAELKALRLELLDILRPSERARVRDYDRVRARRAPFAFESRDVMDLFASAARVLPSRSRERLRELWGKAIAAGLVLPPGAAPAAGP